LCVALDAVERTATPDWMAKRLEQIDQNVHHSMIDITNYVTHELGHPCHAFDYDKIMQLGGLITVEEADPDKKFTTLDGESYTTVGGEVVFTNPDGEIIDLPAIKGTANTAVDDNTKRILLWIESINPEKARFGSMSHAIRTVAAQLNEKHVDPHLADLALQRGVQLYQELCHAQVASSVYNDFPHPVAPQPVTVTSKRISEYLGITIPQETIISIAEALECTLRWTDEQTFELTPPTFRPDIAIAADVIEELARIYGYHNIPSNLMDTPIPLNTPSDTNFTIEHQLKEWLSLLGWQEVYTYSMVSEAVAEQSTFDATEHLKLQNPLTDDKVYLRRSLVPSLTEVLEANPQRTQLSVFELAHVYHPQDTELPEQELQLTLVGQKPVRTIIGDLETLFARFFATLTIAQKTDTSGIIQLISSNSKPNAATIGTIERISNSRTAVTILFADLLPLLNTHPIYQPLPKQAPITEALTFTVPRKTQLGPIISDISGLDPLIYAVTLQDVYQQNITFGITYLHPDKPLASSDVEPVRKAIVSKMESDYAATLVGSLA
ncbi:MAG: phenylalanine--tRNA ligase subunit beta, partial [Patescibacteria group bacterium]